MRRGIAVLLTAVTVFSGCQAQASGGPQDEVMEGLKVFVSVDLEGIAGVVNGDETGSSGPDYQRVRELTTLEAVALAVRSEIE